MNFEHQPHRDSTNAVLEQRNNFLSHLTIEK